MAEPYPDDNESADWIAQDKQAIAAYLTYLDTTRKRYLAQAADLVTGWELINAMRGANYTPYRDDEPIAWLIDRIARLYQNADQMALDRANRLYNNGWRKA